MTQSFEENNWSASFCFIVLCQNNTINYSFFTFHVLNFLFHKYKITIAFLLCYLNFKKNFLLQAGMIYLNIIDPDPSFDLVFGNQNIIKY